MSGTKLQPYFLIGALLAVLATAFYIFKPFLPPVVLGAVFAVVLHPLYLKLVARMRGRESLAALATVVIAMIVILIPTSFLGVQLAKEAQQLYGIVTDQDARASWDSFMERAGDAASPYIPDAEQRIDRFAEDIGAYAQQALTWIIQHIGVAFSGAAGLFLDLFLFFVTLYYLLRDGARLMAYIVELSPLSDRDDDTITARLALAVNSVVKGQMTISLTQGALTGIGFFLFGIPNAVLWGLIAAVASMVPSLGTALVLAPGVAYLAITGSVGGAIGLAVWGAVAVGLVDNFLGPRLMSTGMQLHPLLVLLSVLGGIAFFGPTGIFLGPLTISLLLVLLSIYRDLLKRDEGGMKRVVQ